MVRKYMMHKSLLNALTDKVEEENLPVGLTIGKSYRDYNGDIQVEVLVECDDCDVEDFNRKLNETINQTYNLE